MLSGRPAIGRCAMAAAPPASEKAQLSVLLQGEHSTNALFRAELKKEVTFFRGCAAHFAETSPKSARLVAEGKTAQLMHVLEWLRAYEKPLNERKASFQGPSLVVQISEVSWGEFGGALRGFSSQSAAP
eukprot:gene42511-51937_t